jgi:hypothetical protein
MGVTPTFKNESNNIRKAIGSTPVLLQAYTSRAVCHWYAGQIAQAEQGDGSKCPPAGEPGLLASGRSDASVPGEFTDLLHAARCFPPDSKHPSVMSIWFAS